jgi:hypothetical protein
MGSASGMPPLPPPTGTIAPWRAIEITDIFPVGVNRCDVGSGRQTLLQEIGVGRSNFKFGVLWFLDRPNGSPAKFEI